MPPAPNPDIHSAVTAALAATAGESDTVRSAAVAAAVAAAATAAAGAAVPPPDQGTARILWLILVPVFGLVVLGSAISGFVYALQNKTAPPDIIITIFTTAFSGLIGLFVRPPSSPG
jgi:hypothetical protein